jgi:hypothetical protein
MWFRLPLVSRDALPSSTMLDTLPMMMLLELADLIDAAEVVARGDRARRKVGTSTCATRIETAPAPTGHLSEWDGLENNSDPTRTYAPPTDVRAAALFFGYPRNLWHVHGMRRH